MGEPNRKDLLMKNIAIIAAAAAAVAAMPAAAQESVEIYYGDLDVASAAGTHMLGERLEACAASVCARPDTRDLKGMAAWQECKTTAITSGVEQLASKGINVNAVLSAAK
jgi:UrcA family protein